MKETEKRGKKLVYISEDLLDKVALISKQRGESTVRFIEDLLAQALRIDRLGFAYREIADLLEMVHVQRVLGSSFVPLDVMNSICERNGRDESMLKEWYDSGRTYGIYIRDKYDDPIQILETMLRVMRWDLNEVEARRDGERVVFRCVSTSLSKDGAEWLARFLEGAMDGIGYQKEGGEVMKGLALLSFRKRAS
ncbi:MAG: hypothetical protein Metus_0660 [Candidatus Methanosuratincola subterraneus]|uniref:Uncharacterized protein n=1 Tax=Methanosuratincola subterraneus TaxID=2593994 RepID=A0A3S3RNH9_METS7|nr:MAG: hypothetical protein Metus_0660 [Candidatus Methanosuratincola subterraneus]